ncbi:transglutaminase family protein [Ponticoccus litoralis]|uniref:Transglutaminase family protein n=1 Tax=Ponticoccus litoralis TaxID=422297 RepID=A0AAW9SN68_9RHOB
MLQLIAPVCAAASHFPAPALASVSARAVRDRKPGAARRQKASRQGAAVAVSLHSPPMTRLSITHKTRYSFRRDIALGPHQLMLRPRENRDLSLVSFDLEVWPTPVLRWSQDVAGNAVVSALFPAPARELDITARMVVDLHAPAWPVFPITASASQFPFTYSLDELTDLGTLAQPQYFDQAKRLIGWVESLIASRPIDTLALLKDISKAITAQTYYQGHATEGTQGPLATLDRGWGTCRDFAVLFAEAVRTLGFGARLVSGDLYNPSGESVGIADAGATYAWVEVFVPGAGWIAFDPTNRSVGPANLIAVAVARNIHQISPVSGSFHGTNTDFLGLDVTVNVRRDAGSSTENLRHGSVLLQGRISPEA